jgi:hypothetical protein
MSVGVMKDYELKLRDLRAISCEKSLNLENSLKSEVRLPSSKVTLQSRR